MFHPIGATRISASGENLNRTTNLPQSTAFTVCGWFYVVNDRAGNWRFFVGLEDAVSSSSAYYLLGWSNVNAFYIASSSGNTIFGTNPPFQTWIYFAIVGDGNCYWINPTNMTVNSDSIVSVPTMTEAFLPLGNDSYDEWVDCRLSDIKVYSLNLTQAEIEREMKFVLPQKKEGLDSYHPNLPGSPERGRDYSGNGNDLAEAGTLTDEDPPTIKFVRNLMPPLLAQSVGGLTLLKILAETTNFSEATLRIIAFIRILSDNLNISETLIKVSNFVRIATETLNINEAILRIVAFVRILIETLNLSEIILRVIAFIRILSDTLNVSETLIKVSEFIRVLTEIVNLNETVVRLSGFIRILAETLNIGEGLIKLQGLLQLISETLNISEVLIKLRNLIRRIGEVLNIVSSILSLRSLIRLITNTINLIENVLKVQFFIRLFNEIVNVSEIIIRKFVLFRIIDEGVNLIETTLNVKGLLRVLTETLNLSENLINIRFLIRRINEIVNLNESIVVVGLVKIISLIKGIRVLLAKRGVKLD